MNITQTSKGYPEFQYAVGVTYSGSNIDEAITTTSYGPSDAQGLVGSPDTSTSDVREVDGNAYRMVGGQWYVESGAEAASFLTFPDPRTFVSQINPSADLVEIGTTVVNGVVLTEYRAQNPVAVGNFGVAGLGTGPNVSFNLWLDAQTVVQRMTANSTSRSGACGFETSPVTAPMHCQLSNGTYGVDISFHDVGQPQSVIAPSGAIPGSWPSG